MGFWILAILALVLLFFWINKKRGIKFHDKQLQYIRSHWIIIIDSFHAHPRNAVLDADKLLAYALEKKGYQGTLGEKLKKARSCFSDLNGVWFAHKLRNQVAHELGGINDVDARRALKNFKRALNDLGAGL